MPSDATRHAGEGRHPRFDADGSLKDLDTGFRRHDEIGVAAESIVWAVGIRAKMKALIVLVVDWIELPPTRRPEAAEALCGSVPLW